MIHSNNKLNLSFRNATLDDAEIITNLVNKAYEYELEWKKVTRTNLDEVTGILKENKDMFFLLVNDNVLDDIKTDIIGCIRGEILDDRVSLGMLAIWPQYQKRGYSRLLIDYLTEQSKNRGFKKMELYVASPSTHLFPFYEKFQFVRTGRKEVYPIPTIFESAHFEVFEKDL